ncbi:hypothetical protein B0H14DRAFT_3451224 [Mycena olivaceomarginata]|nr:hypothetical protein B0H14DRAFT_3451224 [Mycena olivaceomarginata]
MVSPEPPSSKRKRPEDGIEPTENAPITRSVPWHSDGSVVLQAQNTQFRVHWSVLALHSQFFRGMQGLPQPKEQPTVDGCPVVVLQDATVDVEHLLRALYDPSHSVPIHREFIRLGRKYDFNTLYHIAIKRLAFENPATLEQYDAWSEAKLAAAAGRPLLDFATTRIVNYPGIQFDFLALARENSLLPMLPFAYFSVANLPLATLLGQSSRPDGTSYLLSPHDRTLTVLGRESLLKAQWHPNSTLGWVAPNLECTEPDECQEWRESFLRRCHLSQRIHVLAPPAFFTNDLCDACAKTAEEAVVAGRAHMWEALPSFFNLPSWSELKKVP